MALPESDIVTGKRMVTVFFQEAFPALQAYPPHRLEGRGCTRVSWQASVFLKAVGQDDLKHPRVPRS